MPIGLALPTAVSADRAHWPMVRRALIRKCMQPLSLAAVTRMQRTIFGCKVRLHRALGKIETTPWRSSSMSSSQQERKRTCPASNVSSFAFQYRQDTCSSSLLQSQRSHSRLERYRLNDFLRLYPSKLILSSDGTEVDWHRHNSTHWQTTMTALHRYVNGKWERSA